MKLLTITIYSIFFMLLCDTGLTAEIYYWTDENGVKHYSNTPPDEENVKVEFKEYQHNKRADQRRSEDGTDP